MIKVILSFSSKVISEGIRALLSSEKDFAITNVYQTRDLIRHITNDNADVIVVDFIVLANAMASGLSGIKTILIDTGCGEENIHYAFLSKSINGFIRADADTGMLVKAIRSVQTGHLWIDNRSVIKLLAHLSILEKLHDLSAREREIISLLGTGMDDERIAATLSIKKKTVIFHVENIMKKAGVTNRWDLMRYSMHYLSYHGYAPPVAGIGAKQ